MNSTKTNTHQKKEMQLAFLQASRTSRSRPRLQSYGMDYFQSVITTDFPNTTVTYSPTGPTLPIPPSSFCSLFSSRRVQQGGLERSSKDFPQSAVPHNTPHPRQQR